MLRLALLFLAAVLGGALNAVAGGGSFIAFPALLFAGVPPVQANATNTVALWPAGAASAFAYRREMQHDRSVLGVLAVASLLGGTGGALLVLRTRESTFVHLLPWLLLFASVVFSFGGRVTARLGHGGERRMPLAVTFVLQLAISLYGGYFGGGMGILMLATLTIMGMTDIHAMNGFKVLLGAVVNGAAVVLFVVARQVAWGPGVTMIVGGALGGFAGAAIARRVAPASVKRLVFVIAWAMTVYFFVRA